MNILRNLPREYGSAADRVEHPTELTRRQAAVYRWIQDFLRQHGNPPSLREIAEATGISSTNAVMCHVRPLIRKGFLRQAGKKAESRSLVLNVPQGHCPCCGQRLPDDRERKIESKP